MPYCEQHTAGRRKYGLVAGDITVLISRLQSSLSKQFSARFGTPGKSVKGSFRLDVQINVPAAHPVSIIHKVANKFGCANFPLVRYVATSANYEVNGKARSLGLKSTKKAGLGPGETCRLGAALELQKALVRQTLSPLTTRSCTHSHTPTAFTRRFESFC
jgi:hypothetical protein